LAACFFELHARQVGKRGFPTLKRRFSADYLTWRVASEALRIPPRFCGERNWRAIPRSRAHGAKLPGTSAREIPRPGPLLSLPNWAMSRLTLMPFHVMRRCIARLGSGPSKGLVKAGAANHPLPGSKPSPRGGRVPLAAVPDGGLIMPRPQSTYPVPLACPNGVTDMRQPDAGGFGGSEVVAGPKSLQLRA